MLSGEADEAEDEEAYPIKVLGLGDHMFSMILQSSSVGSLSLRHCDGRGESLGDQSLSSIFSEMM